MKSRMSVVACFFVGSMLVLSMNVIAFSIDIDVWTGSTSYPLGSDVDIHVEWEITDPSPITPTNCSVTIEVKHKNSTWQESFFAWYIPGSGSFGDFDVWCAGADGTADFDWPSGNAWKSTFFARALVDVQSPQEHVYGSGDSNDFELT